MALFWRHTFTFFKRPTRGRLLGFLLRRSETSIQGLGGVAISRKREMSKAVPRRRRSFGGREAMGPEPRIIARPHPIPQHTPVPRLPAPGRATRPTPGHLPRAQRRAPAPGPAGTGIAFPQLPGKFWPVRTVPPPPPSPHLRLQARAPRPPRTPGGPPLLTPAPARPRPPAQSGPKDPHLGRRSKAPSSPSPSSPP